MLFSFKKQKNFVNAIIVNLTIIPSARVDIPLGNSSKIKSFYKRKTFTFDGSCPNQKRDTIEGKTKLFSFSRSNSFKFYN